MKKFLTITLAVVMMMTLAVSVFAVGEVNSANNNDMDESTEIEVTVNKTDAGTVYYVDVEWGTLEFQYNVTKTWNPTTHQYDFDGEWDNGNTTTVTVKNHSNAPVLATLTTNTNNANGFTATFDDATLELATAVETAVNEAPTLVATATVDAPADNTLDAITTATIGVTVTITDNTPANP